MGFLTFAFWAHISTLLLDRHNNIIIIIINMSVSMRCECVCVCFWVLCVSVYKHMTPLSLGTGFVPKGELNIFLIIVQCIAYRMIKWMPYACNYYQYDGFGMAAYGLNSPRQPIKLMSFKFIFRPCYIHICLRPIDFYVLSKKVSKMMSFSCASRIIWKYNWINSCWSYLISLQLKWIKAT